MYNNLGKIVFLLKHAPTFEFDNTVYESQPFYFENRCRRDVENEMPFVFHQNVILSIYNFSHPHHCVIRSLTI